MSEKQYGGMSRSGSEGLGSSVREYHLLKS